MQHSVDCIYEILANKYNIPKEAIKQIEFDLWKAIRQEMGKKEGKEILLANIGSFYIDKWMVNITKQRIEERIQLLEEQFKNNEFEQITYLYKWMNLNRILKDTNSILEGIEKRKNRKKGDRGL